jgi:hypothetical protein
MMTQRAGAGRAVLVAALLLAGVGAGLTAQADAKTKPTPTPSRSSEVPSSDSDDAEGTPPKPPSTGREAPGATEDSPDTATAKKLIATAMQESKTAGSNCEKILQELLGGLPVVAPRGYTQEYHDAFLTLQDCAARSGHFQTLLMVSSMLFRAGVGQPHPMVRALAQMGRYDEALALVEKLGKKLGDDPDFAAVTTYARCMKAQFTEDWAVCLQTADRTVELAGKAAKGNDLLVGLVYRMTALYFQGKFGEADAAVGQIEKLAPKLPILDDLHSYVGWGQAHHWLAEPVFPPFVPLGVYHLYGNDSTAPAGSLVVLKLYNHTAGNLQFKVELSIPDVTEPLSRTVLVTAGKMSKLLLTPQLRAGFEAAKMRTELRTQFTYKITASDLSDKTAEPVVLEDISPLRLMPPDYLPLMKTVAKDAQQYTLEYIAAWVTPNAPPIDAFLKKAKKRTPDKNFPGEQAPTFPQVQALYEELQSRGVSYVSDPTLTSDLGVIQRTRRPSEVLASTNAQCLEGTILFATLFEAIGLRPLIVTVPGHAFVGWRATEYDGLKAGTPVFLETTLVGSASFKDAVKTAVARVREEIEAGNFEQGVSFLIDLNELRQRGFTPQPQAN